jgi:hypothetical protein
MEFKEIINELKKKDSEDFSNGKIRETRIISLYPEFHKAVLEYTKDIIVGDKFSQKIYHYYHQIPNTVICSVCKTELCAFLSINKGYTRTCGPKCSMYHSETKKNFQNAFMEKYGVTSPSLSKEVQETIKKNNLEKYGVTHTAKLKTVRDKTNATNQERYGSNSPTGSKEVRDKAKKTNLEKYGHENVAQSQVVKDKMAKTNLAKYGYENAAQSDIVKDKVSAIRNKSELENYITKYPKYNFKSMFKGVLTIGCINGHDYETTPMLFSQRVKYSGIENPCIICNPVDVGSIAEKELIDYIKSFGDECIINDRAQIGRELDCYIPSKNIAFEYNGVYCHSEKFKDKNYHIDKKVKAYEKNINLIHIWEDVWILKKHIVKSRIKNILGFSSENIYARNCKIVEVKDLSTCKEFMEENHIQGSINSKIVYALEYNDEIVAMMYFGYARASTGNRKEEGVYELLRFCNKIDTNVVGGASRMFKHFLKEINPISVFSYASLDWSSLGSNVYEKLGFSFSRTTVPNYWYIKKGTRYHRFAFNKKILVSKGMGTEDMTEKHIMDEHGYNRSYDSGSNLYVYNHRVII